MTFDGATKNPMEKAVRDALIAFLAATAEAQAEATKEAQRAGIEHARAKGDGYQGRKPSYTREQLRTVQDTPKGIGDDELGAFIRLVREKRMVTLWFSGPSARDFASNRHRWPRVPTLYEALIAAMGYAAIAPSYSPS